MVWIVIAIVVVIAAVAVAMLLRERRSKALRAGFGPEYERTVEQRGDRRAAERELADREERHKQLDIRELEPDRREAFDERWRVAQRQFVDEPAAAVAAADALVQEVMRARGYPVDEDFERRAADISVDHPVVVEHYRAANAISVRATGDGTATEDLRQAMVHFRALFAELLGGRDHERERMEETR